MTPWLDDGDLKLYHGDCLDVLRGLPDRSAHMCATSPPFYGLRDYGTGRWEGGDPDCDHKHDTRHQAQGATSQRSGRANADDQRNENFRDACGKCGARRVDRQIGLEESPDQWVERLVEVFREVRRVLRDDGTLWVEIGDSYSSGNREGHGTRVGYKQATNLGTIGHDYRPPMPDGIKQKDLLGQPWMLAFALRADGWFLRSEIIWHKVNAMPESVTDRPTKAHSTIFLLSKSARYYFDSDAIREPHKHDGRTVTAVVGREGSIQHRDGERWPGMGANARSVWPLTTEPYSARAHGHGTYYRASADCPKHGLHGDRGKWLAAARGERSAFEGDYHIGGNDARLALEQELADASTATRTPDDRSAATSRSTQSRRTDRAPATSPSCTPSARTGSRTDGTSAQPEPCESAGRTPLNRTEVDGPCAPLEPGPSAETPLRTADTCTCEKCSADHFATWPQKLVARMVKAGTSEYGCCPECGAPWERVAERTPAECYVGGKNVVNVDRNDKGRTAFIGASSSTLGWQPSCSHDHPPVPCTVLDIFAGSGTTLKVARDHGRHSIGIELNEDYLRIAADRLAQQSLLTGEAA